ncbi:MAG: hypothetical protein ACRDNK_24085 [Solirubrobacteraceae bacterium]
MTILGWALILAAVAGLVILDLLVSPRRLGAISFGQAVGWSLFYIALALAVIILVLLATTVASLAKDRANPDLRAHAGALRPRTVSRRRTDAPLAATQTACTRSPRRRTSRPRIRPSSGGLALARPRRARSSIPPARW